MKTYTITLLLLAGFIFTILVINTEHRKEIEDLKVQVKSCKSPGVVTFPNGEYFIVRYYPLNN